MKTTETTGLTATGNQVPVDDALRLLAKTSGSYQAAEPGIDGHEDAAPQVAKSPAERNIRSEVVWWAAAGGTLLLGFSGIRWLQMGSYLFLAGTLALELRSRKQERGAIDQALGVPASGSSVRKMIARTVLWGRHVDALKREEARSAEQ